MARRSEQGQLQRGQACLPCRRKKMRCEAQRPTCAQCLSSARPQDCEYADSASRTYTESLEEEVRRLEEHVLELTASASSRSMEGEDSDAGQRQRASGGETIRLSDPWENWRRRERDEQLRRDSERVSTGTNPASHGTAAQPPSQGTPHDNLVSRLLALSQTSAWWEAEDTPSEVASILMQIFLPHARHLGFGLNIPRLLEGMGFSAPSAPSSPVLSRPPLSRTLSASSTQGSEYRPGHRRPHSSLLSVIYLWALYLTQHPDLTQHIPLFLLRCTTRLTLAMAADTPPSLTPIDTTPVATPRLGYTTFSRTGTASPAPVSSSASGRSTSMSISRPQTAFSTISSSVAGRTTRRDGYLLVQAAQTEVLLAQWFFAGGRLLEGHYHASAAASLAISCKLYKIRSTDSPPSSISPTYSSASQAFLGTGQSALGSLSQAGGGGIAGISSLSGLRSLFELEEPRDSVEENERIDVFWSIFNMDRCWSVVVGSPVIISDEDTLGTRIDTPWPGTTTASQLRNSRTLQNFFSGTPSPSSSLALRAQASALFERASRLVSQRIPSMSSLPHRRYSDLFTQTDVSPNTPSAEREFNALATLTQNFLGRLPALESATLQSLSSEDRRQLLTTHHLTHSALIQLHHVRADSNYASYNVCITAARRVVSIARSYSASPFASEILDPVIITAWMATSRVLVHEHSRWTMQVSTMSGGSGSATSSSGDTNTQESARAQLEGCRNAIVQFRNSLREISRRCSLLAFPVGKALEILEEVTI